MTPQPPTCPSLSSCWPVIHRSREGVKKNWSQYLEMISVQQHLRFIVTKLSDDIDDDPLSGPGKHEIHRNVSQGESSLVPECTHHVENSG